MTLRETYISELIALLSAQPGFPALVERSITVAYTRAESPVLVIHRGSGSISRMLTGEAYRTTEILVSVVARSDAPDKTADDVMAVAHPLIMEYRGAGWVDTRELGTEPPSFANADSQACVVTTRYEIEYRTEQNSLTG